MMFITRDKESTPAYSVVVYNANKHHRINRVEDFVSTMRGNADHFMYCVPSNTKKGICAALSWHEAVHFMIGNKDIHNRRFLHYFSKHKQYVSFNKIQ